MRRRELVSVRMGNVTRLLTYHYPNHTVAALTRPLLSPAHSGQEVELGGADWKSESVPVVEDRDHSPRMA